ncbi:hypothetical protein PR048_010421 [Dryococelus australis]|uniref:Uncharacterized protein n=1 Tax=Dryococelus australis TaxID=614101 RepID=A0ABQ9I2N1_9NEOP|nr:hypothetical protein PR048_010421 [Dryococelus australis]
MLVQDMVVEQLHEPPWACAAFIVRKKSETGDIKYRFCVDYRPLNEVTTPGIYPLPKAGAEENMSAERQNDEQCRLFRQQSNLVERDGLLFKETRLGLRLVVPRSQRDEIPKECRLGLDVVVPMPKTASGNIYLLTIIDHFSR